MNTLKDLTQQLCINIPTIQSIEDILFNNFCLDSRNIKTKDAFVLLKSAVNHNPNNSIAYAQQAAKNCAFILSEIDLMDAQINVPWVFIPNIRHILGSLQQCLLQIQAPTASLPVLAVTGTNGKTSIASIAAQLLTLNHKKVALMGTAGNGIYPHLVPASHTTTDVLNIHQNLHHFAQQHADIMCLEASSHGLHQRRLQGLPIQVAIYTNLSRDHLDYHLTMQAYASAKALLFSADEFPTLNHVIINADDDYAKTMCQALTNSSTYQTNNITLWRYSLTDPTAAFFVSDYTAHISGVTITLQTPFGELTLNSPLLGRFNIANLTAAVAGALAMGVPFNHISAYVQKIHGAVGRMQSYFHPIKKNAVTDNANSNNNQGVNYIIDYAHTPDALAQAINSLRLHSNGNNNINSTTQALHVVFGCGGDRDKGKRPLMMQAALAADHIIVTADNPRSENPLTIIEDMTAELTEKQKANLLIEPDRKTAIALAIKTAQAGDMVLIAGKGHETYQEINSIKHDFDDMAVLRALLSAEITA